jgi:hypothetical protein
VTLETENIRKLNNVSTYPLAISADGVFTWNFLKYQVNIGLTKNILRVGQKEYEWYMDQYEVEVTSFSANI